MSECRSCRCQHIACPGCGAEDWGCNPNRPTGLWVRCYTCWYLWDANGEHVDLPGQRQL